MLAVGVGLACIRAELATGPLVEAGASNNRMAAMKAISQSIKVVSSHQISIAIRVTYVNHAAYLSSSNTNPPGSVLI